MTRRKALALVPLAATAAVPDAVDERIASFHRHWDKFLRAYLGCPKDATAVDQCDLKQGVWEYPEFLKAAKAAKELFELKA